MSKFRKKPVVIEAEQWFPGKPVDGVELNKDRNNTFGYGFGMIHTLEDVGVSTHWVTPGDWIITGVQGEKYACKPDIFEATYEAVDETFPCVENNT